MNLNNTAYKIIADICGLIHVKDNIFVDKYGDKFYWDKYGFHSVFVYSHQEITKKTRFLDGAIKRYNALEEADNTELAKSKRKVIRKIISDPSITDKQKLQRILDKITVTINDIS